MNFIKKNISTMKNKNMRNLKLSVIIGFLAIMISGCSGLKVTSDMDKSVDFNQISTFEYYGWSDDSDEILNDLDKKRIETAFGQEFSKRGLSLIESNADVIVALYIVTENKTKKSATTTGMGGGYGGYGYGGHYGYGPGWGYGPSYGGGMSTTTYNEYDYEVGTLVVSVFDSKKETLIWTSIGKGTIKEDPKDRDKSIQKTVKAIMEKYPIKPLN